MRVLGSLILSSFSAYAFSFAVDLLVGGVLRVYPSTAFLPVVTWSVLATVAFVGAIRLKVAPWSAWAPFGFFTAIALAGGS